MNNEEKEIYIPKHEISLAVIAKDSEETLAQMFESVKDARFEEMILVDTGSKTPKTKEIALAYGAKVYDWQDPRPEFFKKYDFISDFSAARQYSFDLCTNDYVFWLDADDMLKNGFMLHEFLDFSIDIFGPHVALAMKYIYRKDVRGNVQVDQDRTRLVYKPSFFWTERIHEEIVSYEEVKFLSAPEDLCVIHNARMDEEIFRKKNFRNITISEAELSETGKLSERIWKHLGLSYQVEGRYQDAIHCYDQFLNGSTWNKDIYLVSCEKAICLLRLGLYLKAKEVALIAADLCPQYPQAYLALADCCLHYLQYDKALHYCSLAEKHEEKNGIMDNPTQNKLRLWLVRYLAFKECKKYELAKECLLKIQNEYLDQKRLNESLALLDEKIRKQRFFDAYTHVVKELAQEGDKEKLHKFFEFSPSSIKGFEEYSFLKREKRPKDKPSIAFVCPYITFSPEDVNRGVGGSEEAVIFLSHCLSRLGFYVDCFVDKYQGKKHRGEINWYPYHAIQDVDYYDHIILWRSPELVDLNWETPNLYFWCHDVQSTANWNRERVKKLKKFIVLSKFHRSTVPNIPDEKIIYSPNGLWAPHYADLFKVEREANRVCYTSIATRGLSNILQIWPNVHEITGAVLHTYYGLQDVHKRLVANSLADQMEIERVFSLLLKTPGIVQHGMIGQKELAEENAKASVWFYPTMFPEVDCISAKRAQANGAIPVCSNFAALRETVQHGIRIEPSPEMLSQAKSALIELLQDPQRQEKIRAPMIEWARSYFPWENVARNLAKELEGELWQEKLSPTLEVPTSL